MGTPLGDFIRARRDSTSPESVGLPVGERRRAPGLRRAELATLAGISVEYLVRLEQGRDRRPSPEVVQSIARGLRLDPAATDHLVQLAKASSGVCRVPATPVDRAVRPAVLTILRRLEPALAAVTTRAGDLLAHTDGFAALARPLGVLDAPAPNLTRFVFTDPRARAVFPDWDRMADAAAAALWHIRSTALLDELSEQVGEGFTRRLHAHHLPPSTPQRWRHPEVGELLLEPEVLELSSDAQQIVVLQPADDATSTALDRLLQSGSGGLRAVR